MSLSKDSKKILIECKRHTLLQQHVHGTDQSLFVVFSAGLYLATSVRLARVLMSERCAAHQTDPLRFA